MVLFDSSVKQSESQGPLAEHRLHARIYSGYFL
jgi:hypothetical protein